MKSRASTDVESSVNRLEDKELLLQEIDTEGKVKLEKILNPANYNQFCRVLLFV